MKVVCIDESNQPLIGVPILKKGNVYNVIDSRKMEGETKGGIRFMSGTYYVLAECGVSNGYHESMFLKINDDQADESTFERNYNKQTA